MKIKSKVLIIAGSDSSGGAGIQADIKTVSSLGSYAMTAITAVTFKIVLALNQFILSLSTYFKTNWIYFKRYYARCN